jgi:hypothetical protein
MAILGQELLFLDTWHLEHRVLGKFITSGSHWNDPVPNDSCRLIVTIAEKLYMSVQIDGVSRIDRFICGIDVSRWKKYADHNTNVRLGTALN